MTNEIKKLSHHTLSDNDFRVEESGKNCGLMSREQSITILRSRLKRLWLCIMGKAETKWRKQLTMPCMK